MRGSWRVWRLFGIDVRVHWTFLLIVGWVLIGRLSGGADLPAAMGTLGFVLAVFGCVVLHECGHALAARHYGIGTKDITLLPIGGIARLDRLPDEPWREFVVAIAGPLVNVGIAAGLGVVLLTLRGLGALDTMAAASTANPLEGRFLESLLAINLFLAAFNLIPAFPMDGGRILRALLGRWLDHAAATRVAASVGQVLAIGFAVVGLFIGNPFLVFIALFVFLGASAEARHEEMRWAMRGVPVRTAMMTRFRRLAPDDTIKEAADELLAGTQTEFPVTDHDRLLGMLTRDAIITAIRGGDETRSVASVMHPGTDGPGPDAPLDDAFAGLMAGGVRAVPVIAGGRLVGLLTVENLGEWMMLSSARRAPGSRAG